MLNEFATSLAPGNYDPDELRAALVGRATYNMPDTEDPADFVALVDGRIPQSVIWNQTLFHLDTDDTTSDPDDLTVIRTSDNYVYKSGDPDLRVLSALSDTVEDPPEDSAVGDIYLVPAGATGAWASHQDDIAKLTRNGWRYEAPKVGKWLLIEDVDGFKRYSADGWLYGPGVRSFGDASIPLSSALGWGERVIVENQTTTTPPAATKGLRYVVGASATGVWLGKDKQIAICEVPGEWVFYPPGNGWAIYDKNLGGEYHYNGTAWVSAVGAIVGFKRIFNAASSAGTVIGSVAYGGYSPTTSPTTTNIQRRDDAKIAYAAKKSGALLRIRYAAASQFAIPGSPTEFVGCLYRSTGGVSESTPLDWRRVGVWNAAGAIDLEFFIVANDASDHDYIFTLVNFDGSNGSNSFSRRNFTIEEFA